MPRIRFTSRVRDLAKATLDTLMAQLKLKAAVGSLGEDDVAQINTLLDPTNIQ
jgi:outer membrane protein